MSSKMECQNDKITCNVSNNQGDISEVVITNGSVSASFNKSLLKTLLNEQNQLLKKIEKARNEDNYGTYKNLIQALSEITRLVNNERWEDKSSYYKTDEGEFVSTWEQKGKDIRNHKIYKIEKEIKQETYNLYIDWERDLTKTKVYYKDCMYGVQLEKYNDIRDFIIKNIIKNDNVNIYIDCCAVGLGIADSFNELGYKVQDTRLINLNPKRENNILSERVSKYSR